MHTLKSIFAAALLLGLPLAGFAAEPAVEAGKAAVEAKHEATATHEAKGHAEGEHHGLPLYAVKLGKEGSLPITNSMLVTWLVALVLILGAQIATRNVKDVPEGVQNFWEWLVEGLYEFLEGIVGAELVKKTFWFFATIFIMILACNWFGLIPGVGSIGWGHPDESGALHHISRPLFRGANADLNMTFAMSITFFLCWIVWAVQSNGVGGFFSHIFGVKGDSTGWLKGLMVVVFLLVGVLEVVSIAFRPISLSFRLFGNIFAGENMLETMSTMHPIFGFLIALPFYFMELLVGMVQALVFMLLTAVFTMLICQHEEGHGEKHHHH